VSTTRGSSIRGRFRPHVPAALSYAVLVMLILWPAVLHFGTRPMIGTADSSVFYWAWWHLPESALAGRNPLTTTSIFHPVGVDLSLTTTVPLVAFGTWPIRALLGPAAQVNTVQLGAAYASALAAYLVAFRVSRHRCAAFVAGAVFAFTPFRFVHLTDHLNLIHTAFIPVAALLVLRLTDRPTARRGALLGTSLGLAFLTDPQIAVYSATVVAALAVGVAWRDRSALVGPLGVTAVVAVLVALPLLVPMSVAIAGGEADAGTAAEDVTVYSSSPLSWVVPPPGHRVLGTVGDRVDASASAEGLVYPGLIALGLVVIGWRRTGRGQRLPWGLVAVVGFVLSLGPFLSHAGQRSPVPLPFLLLQAVPGLDVIRVPGRFGIVGVLGIAVLAAFGARALLQRAPAGRARLGATALLVALVVADLVPTSLPQRGDSSPEPYHAIAADDGEGAVLDLPLQWATGFELVGDRRGYYSMQMVHATVHGRPLVSGSVSRLSSERLDELLAVPVYRDVIDLQRPGGGAVGEGRLDLEGLRAAGIGYVVYHRDIPVPRVRRAVERLGLPVLADDGTVIVWSVPPNAP
jgi:hypothetical protein